MLELIKLCKSFDSESVFQDYDLKLDKGKAYLLTGSNGVGKTTLIKLIAGIYKPDSGEIKFDRTNNLEQGAVSFCNTNQRTFFFRLTALENLNFYQDLSSPSEEDDQIYSFSRYLGIEKLLNTQSINLSTGQLMLMNIMRSFLGSPKLVLIDESIDSLDQENRLKIASFIEDRISKKNITVIISTHNDDVISSFEDNRIHLS